MANKKVCDWCEKELSRGFLYTVETTITYYGGSNEVKPKPDDKVEICESCYRKSVMPLFGWQREIIIVPESRAEAEHLTQTSQVFREEFDRKRKEEWKRFEEQARIVAGSNKSEPVDERVTTS